MPGEDSEIRLRMSDIDEVHLVGCGGGGSWLAGPLIRLLKFKSDNPSLEIHLWDNDHLERHNLERQGFGSAWLGAKKTKAEMVSSNFCDLVGPKQIQVHNEWFHANSTIRPNSIIICCADNHPARRACLMQVDNLGGACYIAGNEYTEAEAYVYFARWKGTQLDPRVRMPNLLKGEAGCPMATAACAEEAKTSAPQLVVANFEAAAYVLKLLWFWGAEWHIKGNKETLPFAPVHIRSNFSKIITNTVHTIMEGKV